MSMDNDQESLQFWSTILQTLTDSSPKYDLNPEINSPILVMSTSMAVNVPPEPSNPHGVGYKEARQEKVASEDGDKKMNVDRGKSMAIEIEESKAKEEETKNLKRPNEARNLAEKRDIASTLDCIIDHIREMKQYVESQSMGPMLPLGMRMDFPAPWTFPFVPPNFFMPFNGQGEASGRDQQIVPATTQV
ncbi:unnamed protein product [Microthlaspi erraticum]|uniref:Uncharacterized protein n=1 Tax=Microthlaspi erraticum TaxID=1685480 RepID=A0A6D2LAU4_9BRAS|nr:unnamed protein product [Microthlaspi erraticum]